MSHSRQPEVTLVLMPRTARDLMSPNPVSINRSAAVGEATALLAGRGFGAVPVIDDAGRPVGVVSRTDLLLHDREHLTHQTVAERAPGEGRTVEEADPTPVADVMTPVVLSLPEELSADEVVERLLRWHVHQVYVVDAGGVLVGVITPLDVLRRLTPSGGIT